MDQSAVASFQTHKQVQSQGTGDQSLEILQTNAAMTIALSFNQPHSKILFETTPQIDASRAEFSNASSQTDCWVISSQSAQEDY
ncbi:hypothetical protein [Sulfurirhabdus autotrophica]|uniref:hypothetical protein n=1 Tax=Sulfurirhabdus autotrophica TaxID=1706046 RepID=UPI000F60AE01|nr:hypothetical protein [Sulfurirhabdus autotrophica]